MALALWAAAGLASTSSPSLASDHIDGLKTAADNAADLTDLFVFTSPTDSQKLVLIMNVHGVAFSRSRFSNAVDYRFRIRPIADAKTLTPSTDASKERSIVCNFSGGALLIAASQHATCTLNLLDGSEVITFDTRGDDFKAGGAGQRGSTRVFAGVRSDPWFLDLAKTLKFNGGQPVAKGAGVNGLFGQNVLSIVVEVDKNRLPGPLLGVTAQTVRR
jgi:hypothetical protein